MPELDAAEHLRLPAELGAPSIARRRVTDVLVRAERVELLETAVLLTSEIVTNVVVHAGTPIELRISLDEHGLTVAVSDSNPGPLGGPPGAVPGEVGESGRGLTLVHALAERWGVTHSRAGKTIWFTVTAAPAGEAAPPAAPVTVSAEPVRAVPLALGGQLASRLGQAEALGELLSRLLDTVAADAGRVLLAPDGGGAPEVVALRGDPALFESAASRLRAPLSALGARVGEVEVVAAREGAFGPQAAGWVDLLAFEMALTAALSRQTEADSARQGWASFLAEASDLLAGSLDVPRTLALVCQLAVSRLATWSAAHLYEAAGTLRLTAVGHVDEGRLPELRARLEGGEFIDLLSGRRPGARVVLRLGEEAGVAVPLRARGRELGWLTLMRPAASQLRPAEVAVIADLAHRAGLAVDNARLFGEQVAVARALQSGLLPPQLPPPGELDFGACYHAARQDLAVGGDFYDVMRLSDDEWVLAIGDVCGKGAEAAAVTGAARDVLRLLLRQGQQVPDALRQLNEALLYAEHGRFCTVAVARLHRSGAGWAAQVWSAGHPPPALLGPDGGVRLVGSGGTLLGVLPSDALELVDAELTLSPGHALVLYTDGVTERRQGSHQFGELGLLGALRDCASLSAQAVAGHLDRAAEAFTDEEMRDDTAVLVARVPVGERARGIVAPRAAADLTG